MNKPNYEKPIVEVLTSKELLEVYGVVECASGSSGGGGGE